MTKYICLVNILKEEILCSSSFREGKSGVDASPAVLHRLLLFARRAIVYTIFGLNVLLAHVAMSQRQYWCGGM